MLRSVHADGKSGPEVSYWQGLEAELRLNYSAFSAISVPLW